MFTSPHAPALGGPTLALSLRRSIFDIVYPTTPNGTDRRPNPLAPRAAPVNFLYMGSFLRFKKLGRHS